MPAGEEPPARRRLPEAVGRWAHWVEARVRGAPAAPPLAQCRDGDPPGPDPPSSSWERAAYHHRLAPPHLAAGLGPALFPGGPTAIAGVTALQAALHAGGELLDAADVHLVRCRGGRKEAFAGTADGTFAVGQLEALHGAGWTVQLHQPQRFAQFDALWGVCARLEASFQCLVGSNAYLTPAGAQGLAPHYDDVNLWMVQTHGAKAWKIYRPGEGEGLPSRSSGDLSPSELPGEPALEVVLRAGEFLFLPRGWVHWGQAVGTEGSCHVTISTYQRWTFAALAAEVCATAADQPFPLVGTRDTFRPDPLLRAGLPVGLGQAHGTFGAFVGTVPRNPLRRTLAQGLRALADAVEQEGGAGGLVPMAVDSLHRDFVEHRLPPHPSQLPIEKEVRGREPFIRAWPPPLGDELVEVAFELGYQPGYDGDQALFKVASEWISFEMLPDTTGVQRPAGQPGGSRRNAGSFPFRVRTCLHNDRRAHMVEPAQDDEDDEGEGEGSAEEEEEGGPPRSWGFADFVAEGPPERSMHQLWVELASPESMGVTLTRMVKTFFLRQEDGEWKEGGMAKAKARALEFVRGTLVPMGVLYVSVGREGGGRRAEALVQRGPKMMDKIAQFRQNKKPRRGTR